MPIFKIAKMTVLLLMIPIFLGCAKQQSEKMVVLEPQSPAALQADRLEPGLSTIYFDDFYRYIYQMPTTEGLIAMEGRPGPPILQINHRFGAGKVFDSGRNKGVGILMRGFFHLEQPGQYAFQSLSNDGFELQINDQVIINDPEVHSDKLSSPGQITVAEGGWFPVKLRYFQRKGTATLVLNWKPPGADSFTVVPANIYAHMPE